MDPPQVGPLLDEILATCLHVDTVLLALFQHRTKLWLDPTSVLTDARFKVTGSRPGPKTGPADFLLVPN